MGYYEEEAPRGEVAAFEASWIDPQEAYGTVAGEMYVPGEVDYCAPDDVLALLDEEIVKVAKQYAVENQLPWPPIASGMVMTMTGWTE